jgi:phenylacetate-coenzyme A ligase PaaK-like adenylate-forming protein
MARVNMKLPDDFMNKISRLGEKTDEIVPRVLQAGAEVVEAKVRSNLQAAIGSNTQDESRSTGELVGALGISPAKLDRNGNYDVCESGLPRTPQ